MALNLLVSPFSRTTPCTLTEIVMFYIGELNTNVVIIL